MEQLGTADLRTLVDVLGDIADIDSLDEFRTRALSELGRLVPYEIAGYNEVRPGEAAVAVLDPEDAGFPEVDEILAAHALENPLIVEVIRGNKRALKFSDFLTLKELHRLPIYDLLYRPLRSEHQMAFALPNGGAHVVGLAFNRGRHDFDERDRTMLDLARPVLARIYELLRDRELLRAAVDLHASPEALLDLGLTEREAEILAEVARGTTNSAIAASLGIAQRTVEKHLQRVYQKLGVGTRTAAVRKVAELLADMPR